MVTSAFYRCHKRGVRLPSQNGLVLVRHPETGRITNIYRNQCETQYKLKPVGTEKHKFPSTQEKNLRGLMP